MSNRTVHPTVARLSAASALLVLGVSTVLALPTAGHCRSQYQHIDVIVATPKPEPTPTAAAPLSTNSASRGTESSGVLAALLSATFVGAVASKIAANGSQKDL